MNIDYSKCIHSITHLGSTEYVNICSGTHTILLWGAGDWLLFWFLAVLGGLLIGVIGFLVKIMMSEL